MGWSSAGSIFDPVAYALVELGASDETKIRVLGDLIAVLQENDWDTEDESLGQFQDDAAVVEAFRRNDVIIYCGAESNVGDWCELERDHGGDYHEDDAGSRWNSLGHLSAYLSKQASERKD